METLRKHRSLSEAAVFHCKICDDIIVKPKECFECGGVFCEACIEPYLTMGKNCPGGCHNSSIKDMSMGLKRIYNEIDLKCKYHETCKKVMKITDIENHEEDCQSPPCKMKQICANNITKNKKYTKQFCSQECYVMSLLKSTKDEKEAYLTLNKVIPAKHHQSKFEWDDKFKASFIQVMGNRVKAENAPVYSFISVVAKNGYSSGEHYWEISDLANESLLKIGVTKTKFNIQSISFSDLPTGFAFYALGQLRNGSDCKGPSYGIKPNYGSPIGVYLNMDTGVLGFVINGNYCGPAFTSSELINGKIYPAVAFLKSIDATIIEKPIPGFIKNK